MRDLDYNTVSQMGRIPPQGRNSEVLGRNLVLSGKWGGSWGRNLGYGRIRPTVPKLIENRDIYNIMLTAQVARVQE